MGVSDPKVKAQIVDVQHVCDMVNGGLFHGAQVLDPAKMKRLPESAAVVFQDGSGKEKKAERTMDGLFAYEESGFFVFFSLENQHDVSYIMPVREMLGTALLYNRQLAERRKELKEEKGYKNSGEFLSDFLKEDGLKPVCCIAFYYGEEPWDGATSLHELLDFPPGLEGLREFCPDFRSNLIDYNHVNPDDFQTGLRQLFELLPYAGNKKKLCEYVKANKERYENLDDESCDLLEAFLGMKVLDQIGRGHHRNEKEGGYDMCTAIEDLIRDSKAEGRGEGKMECICDSILAILRSRGSVTEELSARIREVTDYSVLQKWLLLAADAENAAVFEAAI